MRGQRCLAGPPSQGRRRVLVHRRESWTVADVAVAACIFVLQFRPRGLGGHGLSYFRYWCVHMCLCVSHGLFVFGRYQDLIFVIRLCPGLRGKDASLNGQRRLNTDLFSIFCSSTNRLALTAIAFFSL